MGYKKMKLSSFFVVGAFAEEERKKPWTVENSILSDIAKEKFAETNAPIKNLQKLYTTKLENYGKKDYQVYADGLSKWQGKMGKAFEKRVKKCGDAYFSDESRKRRSEETEEKKKNKDKNKNKNKNKNKEEPAPVDPEPEEVTEAPATEAPVTEAPVIEATTEAAGPDNSVCMLFRDGLIPLIEWSAKHLAECSYDAKKGGTKTMKADKKFANKWKKVMAQFQHGAYNQPNGSLCEKEWVAFPEE